MKALVNSVALLALLTGPALAQEKAELDAFGIEGSGVPLDQLSPDDGAAGPAMPTAQDEVPAEPAPQATAPAAPAADALAAPEITGFEPPSDWQERSVAGYSFRFPGDWQMMQDSKDEVAIFNGDVEAQQGGVFLISMDKPDNMMPPGAEISLDTKVTVSGQPFRRLELTMKIDASHSAEMIMLISEKPVDRDDHLIISGGATGRPLSEYRQAIEQMMGSLRYTAPLIEPDTALDGLIVYAVPNGWQTMRTTDGMVMYPNVYSASITVLKGDAVDGYSGIETKVPENAFKGYATVLGGHPAQSSAWQGVEAEYVQDKSMVTGSYTLFRLTDCAPDGAPLALVLAGIPETLESQAFKDALDDVGFAEGVKLGACREAPSGAGPDTAGPDTAGPDTSAAPQAKAPPLVAQNSAGAPAPALPLQVEVGGVSYLLPEGWQSTYSSAEDKMWASPDGRFTILSFWWFPDEPLLGYADTTSVENTVVDHEPVTRIHNSGNGLSTIQNVTERARGDGKRFIFTVETTSAAPQDLTALHDLLVPTLRFAAGFDPKKPVEFAAQPAPNATPPQAPASQLDLPPPPPEPLAEPMAEPDSFTDQGGGYSLYHNTRFGSEISYPSSYFAANPPPDNGDGRKFLSADGQSSFLIFAQHDVFGLSQDEMMQQDVAGLGGKTVTYRKSGRGWYVLSGNAGGDIFYRKVLIAADSVTHVFEIRYPTALKAAFDPVVAHMAKSFGLNPNSAVQQPSATAATPPAADLPSGTSNASELSKGWWIIVGTFPAEPWQRQKADLQSMQSMAAGCHLQLFNDFSDKFRGFSPGYNVFVIGAFESKSVATDKLQQIRTCFPDAYAKYGEYLGE